MKKKLTILLSFILLVGCSLFIFISKKSDTKSYTAPKNNVLDEERAKPTNNEIQYISPYTGENLSKSAYNNIPFMAIIENSKPARPQSGLSEADIVYETMAEGGIPRFIAIFHSKSPKVIGPVRSARSYFVSLSLEYNLPFAHCGGSPEALIRISDEHLMSMNEIKNGNYYYRDNTRTAPHNLYTSAEKIRSLITTLNFTQKPSSGIKFDKDYWNKNFSSAATINMVLNRYYSTSYEYKDGLYYKSMDNVKSIDKADNTDIAVKNIVIQVTDIETRTDGRLNIRQLGEGTGYVISNGKYMKIKWMKDKENSPTILLDEGGKAVKLSPGKTWWHITDANCNFEFD